MKYITAIMALLVIGLIPLTMLIGGPDILGTYEIIEEQRKFCEEEMKGFFKSNNDPHLSKCRIEIEENVYEEFLISGVDEEEYYLLKW